MRKLHSGIGKRCPAHIALLVVISSKNGAYWYLSLCFVQVLCLLVHVTSGHHQMATTTDHHQLFPMVLVDHVKWYGEGPMLRNTEIDDWYTTERAFYGDLYENIRTFFLVFAHT